MTNFSTCYMGSRDFQSCNLWGLFWSLRTLFQFSSGNIIERWALLSILSFVWVHLRILIFSSSPHCFEPSWYCPWRGSNFDCIRVLSAFSGRRSNVRPWGEHTHGTDLKQLFVLAYRRASQVPPKIRLHLTWCDYTHWNPPRVGSSAISIWRSLPQA